MALALVQYGNTSLFGNGITSASTAFSDTTDTPFGLNSTPTTNNPDLTVVGGGPAGADLHTSIVTWINHQSVTLAAAASNTSTTNAWTWGLSQGTTTSGGAFTELSIICTSSVTSGNLLCVCTKYDPALANTATIVDTIGNTWTRAGGQVGQSYNQVVWYSKNIAGGANTIKVTYPASVEGFAMVSFFEISGADLTNPFDQLVFASGNSTSPSATTATLAKANEVGLAFAAVDNVVTAGGGAWTQEVTDVFGGRDQYIIVSATTALTATATQSPTGHWDMAIAMFKQASSAIVPKDPIGYSSYA